MRLFAIFVALATFSITTFGQQSSVGPSNAEQFRWLYELILPQAVRQAQPAEAFKSFRVHLEDSYQQFPLPEDIQAKNLNSFSHIAGTIKYAGIINKNYKYDVEVNPANEITLTVKIHLQNPTGADKVEFLNKLKLAQQIWNADRVATDFNYQFKFEIVNDQADSHFSVFIRDTTTGPYDTFWGRDWTEKTISHEVGHMLGLGDEYQTISGKFDCYKPSLMCTAWTGSLMAHHYYFVLRRLIK